MMASRVDVFVTLLLNNGLYHAKPSRRPRRLNTR